jgi:hypothetical protein
VDAQITGELAAQQMEGSIDLENAQALPFTGNKN